MVSIQSLYGLLSRYRFDVSSEKPLQEQIAQVLSKADLIFAREVILSTRDRIDFLVEGIGVEVKIKGSPSEIYQQCRRYCASEHVRELLLVTSRAMGFPREIEGKPCYYLQLGRSWL